MRIVIDMQGAQSESRFRGIGRYSISLSLAIARNAGKHEIFLLLNAAFPENILDIRNAFEGLIPKENIYVFEVPLSVAEENPANENKTRVAELIREYYLEQLNPDVILVTSLFEGYMDDAVVSIGKFSSGNKTAVILYDLIPLLHKKTYLASQQQEKYYMQKIESLKSAGLLLSISESSRKEALLALDMDNNKIYNISTAIDESFSKHILTDSEKKEFYKKYSINRDMILYAPGGFDIRKNFEGLIKAYSLLSNDLRQKYQLTIVSKIQDGNRLELVTLAKNAGLKENEMILTGYVSDEDLITFYSLSSLFVFPSKHEGFGLPVLEAMACGVPVIGSNTTSIPEVIGCEEALFNPESPQSISEKIEQVLIDEKFRIDLMRKEQEHKDNFSWDTSSLKAIKQMEILSQKEQITDEENVNKKSTYPRLIKKIAELVVDKNEITQISYCLDVNTINNDKTIWIDITQLYIHDSKTGIQRVVRSVISEIYKEQSKNYNIGLVYLECENGIWKYKRASKYENNFLVTNTYCNGDIVEAYKGDIFLGLDLNSIVIEAQKQKLLTRWKNRGVEIAFVIYDILPIHHPEWWPENGNKLHEEWLRTIAIVADKLISISNAVSNEAKEWIEDNNIKRVKPIDYSFFHIGANIENMLVSSELPKGAENVLKIISSKETFLMVGTIEPRKGHKQTLNAFEKLWAEGLDINLVIVGKEGWLVDELIRKIKNHPELDKRLFWLEGISDEYLEKVYETSTCLIAASEGEGFGLPLIEAAQKKMPILARDIPVFQEVAGKYAYYFENSKNASVIVDAIKNWLQLYKENKHPKSDTMPWLTWEESTKQLLECLNIKNNSNTKGR